MDPSVIHVDAGDVKRITGILTGTWIIKILLNYIDNMLSPLIFKIYIFIVSHGLIMNI